MTAFKFDNWIIERGCVCPTCDIGIMKKEKQTSELGIFYKVDIQIIAEVWQCPNCGDAYDTDLSGYVTNETFKAIKHYMDEIEHESPCSHY